MTLRKKLLPTFTKAVSGQTATCNLDLGKKYHVIWLVLGYDAANAGKTIQPADPANDMIGEIRLLVNGKVQRRIRGRELNALNKLNGDQYAAKDSVDIASGGVLGSTGYRVRLPIYLAEPWRKSNAETALMGWNLAGVTVASASIEVDFLTIDTPFISGYYEWSPPDGGLGAGGEADRSWRRFLCRPDAALGCEGGLQWPQGNPAAAERAGEVRSSPPRVE